METNESLIRRIISPGNLNLAFLKVKRNKGAAGVDAKDIEATAFILKSRERKSSDLYRTENISPSR